LLKEQEMTAETLSDERILKSAGGLVMT